MDKRPSEVFLKLWLAATCHACQGEDEFRECAESWFRIRRMEEAGEDPSTPLCSAQDDKGAPAPTGLDEGVESAPAEASKNDGEDVVQNGPVLKKSPWEAFRENTRRKVLNARFSSQQIAEASGGAVTVDDLRAVVDGTLIVPGNTVSAINKALDKLEGKG